MEKLKKQLATKTFGLIVITVLFILLVYVINNGFLARTSIRNMLNTLAYQGPLLAGFAILLMSGNFDFSSAGVAALSSLVFAAIMQALPGMPWPVAVLTAMCSGAFLGLVNVFFMNVVNLMPFIVTIGTSSIFAGFATVWTHGGQLPVNNQGFLNLSKIALFNTVPLLFIITVLIILLHTFVLYKTRFGRSIYMVGGNPFAARLCGLSIKKTRAILFTSSGVWASVAGLMWVAMRKQSNPATFVAASPHLTAIIAALLGGVSFMGGAGGMGGACIGLVLYNVLQIGLTYLKAPIYITTAVTGLLLIAALIFDNFNAMRMRQKLKVAAIKEGSKAGAAK